MKTLSVLASLVTLGVAAPASTLTPHEITRYSTRPRAAILEDRGAPVCEYHGHISADSYTVLNHVETGFEGGSQCITVNDSSENVLSWGSTWTWSPSQWLKAYPNARVQGHRKMLSEYKSIPVSWKWSYDGSDVVANVNWAMTSSGGFCEAQLTWVLQVWIGTIGNVSPPSTTGSPVGTTTINGVEFDVYQGYDIGASWHTFVATTSQTDFKGDLLDFSNYLGYNGCIRAIQGGTEIYGGTDATFTSSSYSVEQNF